MKQITGNMFNIAHTYDAIAITTNGFVTSRGNAVMGRGCAKTISDRYPDIKPLLGAKLKEGGNQVYALAKGPYYVVSFPVKGIMEPNTGHNVVRHARSKYPVGASVPGFHLKADIEIIARSAYQLLALANKNGWTRILVPRPGCGAGELDWHREVEPILDRIFDDRFAVITFN